jgi:heat-inducible transcriptional repressor
MPPVARSLLEHIRFLSLPDGRVVVVLISAGGEARDKVLRPEHEFTQAELDRTADYLNRHYGGWTLAAIRTDMLAKLASERERYGRLLPAALELCDPAVLDSNQGRQVYVEGTAQFASTPELAGAEPLRELLAAIEEKTKLVTLLNACIDAPEPVHIQIGVKEINAAGEHLSLITAPYLVREYGQGSLGVLGPMRMEYERAITAVAYVARAFSEILSRT